MATALDDAGDLLARLIGVLTVVVVALIALGIVFEVLSANENKWVVSTVLDVAGWLAAPFDDMFMPDNEKFAVAVNWGIAIVVYAIVGRVLSALAGRVGDPGESPSHR